VYYKSRLSGCSMGIMRGCGWPDEHQYHRWRCARCVLSCRVAACHAVPSC
jgi:hypothetical protein